MTAPVCFIDTETMGLDPDTHPIWELALIVDDLEYVIRFDADPNIGDPIALNISGFHERHWRGNGSQCDSFRPGCPQVDTWASVDRPDTLTADNMHPRFTSPAGALHQVARLTHGRHLVGAVVSFDEERLRRWMRAEMIVPSWHYHLIDVETLAVGALTKFALDLADGRAPHMASEAEIARLREIARPPWDSKALSRAIGVDPDQFPAHTALGDARWAKAIYEQVMGE